MRYASTFVRSNPFWDRIDAGFFARHPERQFRVRTLYPVESVVIDKQHREIPPKGAPVLKIIKQIAPGRHVTQAFKSADRAGVSEALAALSTDEAAEAALDLFAAEDVIDLQEVRAIARARHPERQWLQ